MTDKEWKEVLVWAESLKNKSIKIFYDTIFIGNDFGWGEIMIRYPGNIFLEDNIIVLNRSQKQVKAIIENLL